MTVFAKDITYGLESTVKELQEHIESNLAWLGTNEIYGLIYKTKDSENNTIPEAYKGIGIKNTEYTNNIFVNDKVTSTIGFLEIGDRNLMNGNYANVDIIVTMRLDKAFNTDLREDEKALLQFQRILINFYGINYVNSAKLGIDDVFSAFYTDNFKDRDMHPWLIFSMNVDLIYNDDIDCDIVNVN